MRAQTLLARNQPIYVYNEHGKTNSAMFSTPYHMTSKMARQRAAHRRACSTPGHGDCRGDGVSLQMIKLLWFRLISAPGKFLLRNQAALGFVSNRDRRLAVWRLVILSARGEIRRGVYRNISLVPWWCNQAEIKIMKLNTIEATI
jgi:hypothetical protein